MSNSRRVAGIAVALGTAVCGAGLFAPQASAATAAATYNGACGSGFTVVNSAPVGTLGTVFLTYKSSTGQNCVVTVRNNPGDPTWMTAALIRSDAIDPFPEEDTGEYRSYAGPVYVDARGACVNWWGIIGNQEGGKNGTNCAARVAGAR
jgi:hypothetical protein